MVMLVAGFAMVAWPMLVAAQPAAAANSTVVKQDGLTFTANDGLVTICKVALEMDRNTDDGNLIVIGAVSNQSGIPDCTIAIILTITYKDQSGHNATAAVAARNNVQLRLDNAASSILVKADVTWTECNQAANPTCGVSMSIASK